MKNLNKRTKNLGILDIVLAKFTIAAMTLLVIKVQ